MKRLRIAVTKGRLLEDSLALFEQAGLDCTEVRADTRKLILPIANYPMDVVLSKAFSTPFPGFTRCSSAFPAACA